MQNFKLYPYKGVRSWGSLVTVALARNDVFNTYGHVVRSQTNMTQCLSQMSRRRASGNETNEHAVTN